MVGLVLLAAALAACGGSVRSEEDAASQEVTSKDPNAPRAPKAFTRSASSIGLVWAAPTNHAQVVRYHVYRDGTHLAQVTAPANTFTDTRLAPARTYSYTVRAQVKSGAVSNPSPAAGATTLFLTSHGVGFAVPSYPWPTDAQQEAWFADMHGLGARYLRFDFAWALLQKTSESAAYDWERYDTLVKHAADAGLKIDAVVDSVPVWARASACRTENECPPADPAAFAQFAANVVKRYHRSLVSVEIWNEPNIYQFWKPVPNATAYGALLRASSAAIRATGVQVPILLGGLSIAATDAVGHYLAAPTFLERLYEEGLGASFDAVAYHPYSYPLPPSFYATSSGWSQIDATKVSMRSVMAQNGDAQKALWITEYGAPTGGPDAAVATCTSFNFSGRRKENECLQARSYEEAIEAVHADDSFGPLFLYSYRDRGTSSSTVENFFGITRYDGTRKQSWASVRSAIHDP